MKSNLPERPQRRTTLPVVPCAILLGAGALLLLMRILILRTIGIGLIVLAAELFFIHLYESLLPRDQGDPDKIDQSQPKAGPQSDSFPWE